MKTSCIVIWMLLCFSGCNLFKSTSRNSRTNTQTSKMQAALSQFVLKSANKETQVFTYWNDSSAYQYRLIKERVNEAKSDQLKTEKQDQIKQEQTIKESEPIQVLLYVGIVIAVIGCCYFIGFLKRIKAA